MRDSHASVRRSAFSIVIFHAHEKDFPEEGYQIIFKALKDSSAPIRESAIGVMTNLKLSISKDIILKALKSRRKGEVIAALRYIHELDILDDEFQKAVVMAMYLLPSSELTSLINNNSTSKLGLLIQEKFVFKHIYPPNKKIMNDEQSQID